MKVAIYSRGLDDRQQIPLLALINELHKYKASIAVSGTLAEKYWDAMSAIQNITVFNDKSSLDETTDCLISLGGDGTILDAVTLIGDKNIPILGINFGRLGFLASIGKEELSIAVDALVNGTYVADKRILIHLDSDLPLFGDAPFALNEFGIHKRDTSPMIKVHTYLNGEFLNSYWADGLVVSTPTGSTGYSMSCNGPIVFPDSSSFCITPVAPHNLNIRPIIVPDSNIVSFEIEGRSEQFICTLDARKEIVEKNIQLAVKKERFTVSLIRLNENSFLSTLRSKLTWGLDKRN
ncbi:NAD kinase [Ilyomonas limi]|jgi:NAD+ kinase|uniref:NAD kinase n=1 Tax=Ilyomonas limi TaxID=2575867 RepID=A0A4U3KW04_9BACT|nr:NAD kinase [Ilyomonas limi]TKK66688.1 NAD kinase [Ilyomonas limi]